jgi:hypothetical protein
MRSARSDRGPGWPVVALAALAGVLVGLSLPRAEQTGALFVDAHAVSASFEVGSCSGSWAAQVATLTPVRHWDFAASADPAGDLPAPGLLLCDATGARSLHGGLEENVADPAGAIPDASVGGVALWVSLSDTTTPGDLIWLTQADGYGMGLQVSAGQLELVEVPSGGGAATVLAQTPAPAPGPHLLTVARSGGTAVLYVDTAATATVTLSPGSGDLTMVLGAPSGSGDSAANGAVDEVLVLPAPPTPATVSALVAANGW